MVREGKMAKVAVCKEAQVKHPVLGVTRTPVQGSVIDGSVLAQEVQEMREIPSLHVQDVVAGADRISKAYVRDAVSEADRISKAHVQDAVSGADRISKAHVQDVVSGGDRISKAYVQKVDSGADGFSCVPIREAGFDVSGEEQTPVQNFQPVRADDSLTLAQLFSKEN